MKTYVRSAIRLVLMGLQLFVAAFYAVAAASMWEPFTAGPMWAKLILVTIVCWPALSIVVILRKSRIFSLGTTSIVALFTLVQLLIVFVVLVVTP